MNKESTLYEVRIQGRVAKHRTRKFVGLTVAHRSNGDTALAGPISDQAALYGLLLWLHSIGLPLLFIRWIEEQTGSSLNCEPTFDRQKGVCDGQLGCDNRLWVDGLQREECRAQGTGCARAIASKAGAGRLAPLDTGACPREQVSIFSELQAARDRIGLEQRWQDHTKSGRQTVVAGDTDQ